MVTFTRCSSSYLRSGQREPDSSRSASSVNASTCSGSSSSTFLQSATVRSKSSSTQRRALFEYGEQLVPLLQRGERGVEALQRARRGPRVEALRAAEQLGGARRLFERADEQLAEREAGLGFLLWLQLRHHLFEQRSERL